MILSIVVFLISIPVLYIIVFVAKEILAYRRLDFYRRQGVKVTYKAIFGYAENFLPKKLPNGKVDSDDIGVFKSNIGSAARNNEKAMVWNNTSRMLNVIFPIDRALIKEFMTRELDILKKETIIPMFEFGLLTSSGKEALRKRGVFSRFFHQENLRLMIPKIDKIIEEGVQKLYEKYWSSSEKNHEYKEIDFRRELSLIMDRVVKVFIMNSEDIKSVDISNLTMDIMDLGTELGKIVRSPLYIMTGGYLSRLGLNPAMNKLLKKFHVVEDTCLQIYEERKELRKTVPCPEDRLNFVDMIVEDDKERKDGQQWTGKEIAENLFLIQFAGIDTIV